MGKSGKRVTSIDCLRGLSMFVMIFGAAIWWYGDLPAWFFHCQTPPPDYAFHPEVRGLNVIDLVFPFFLFSMGAAIPFALRKRISRPESTRSIVLGLVRRWVTLVTFSLLLGNTGLMPGWDGPDVVKGIFSVVTWGGFFLSLWRTDRKWVARTGYLILLAALAFEKFYCHLPLDVHNTDVIIMILAWVALFGGLIWLLTKDRLKLRGLILLFIIAVKAVCAYTDILGFLAVPGSIGWLFDWGFLQYLIIAIPASMIGDYLNDKSPVTVERTWKNVSSVVMIVAALVIQPWLLYKRFVLADVCATAVLFCAWLAIKPKKTFALSGFGLLLLGLCFDFIDGGIAKDYCNLSYLFTTAGMASLTVAALEMFESFGGKSHFLADCGQNPMIAYTICWYVISPLLYGIGLLGLIDSLCPGSPFWSIIRGLVVTGAMCASTAFFTRRKIFWRS